MTLRRLGLGTAAVGAALVFASAAVERIVVAQQPAPRNALLSRPLSLAAPRIAPPLDPWERRSRLVSPNAGALPNRATARQAPGTASEISIDLFDGASITAVFDRFDPNDTGVTWVGHVPAYPDSRVTLVSGGGLLAASIVLPGASYTIRPAPIDAGAPVPLSSDAIHVLAQVNSDSFPREAAPIIAEIPTASLDAAADVVMADTAEFIDVLIVYTALAEAGSGGPAGILNWINLAISETNAAYASSGVNQRVRLVHTERVAYTEVANFNTNLTNLRAGSAGLSTVAALRNAYTADLVSMFVRPVGPDACGIGFLMTTVSTAFAPNGYSVVYSPCASPNGTLAHEFGHNMGLRHDWFMDRGITPSTYAHGYVSLAGQFRTIMSYPDACAARGISCARLLSFSNPDMTHLGQPMGVPGGTNASCPTGNALDMSCDADERRALNDTAFVVANFREFSDVRPPLIRTQPQNQSVARGQALTLRVEAEGLGPITYQWYRGAAPTVGQPIPGATGPAVTLVPGADGIWFERWFYWVQVANSIGTVNSLTATITMVAPGADVSLPQRFSQRYAPNARRQGPGTGISAQPRVQLDVPPAAPASPVVVQLSRVTPPARVTPTDPAEHRGVCGHAAIEVALTWAALAQRPADVAAFTRFMRALFALDDDSCGARRPHG